MTTQFWIMLYAALGLGWAYISAKQIIPAIRSTLHDTPVNIQGLSPERALKLQEFTKNLKKRLNESMLPDSWLIPILAICVLLICLERGLLWPISVVKYVIKRWND